VGSAEYDLFLRIDSNSRGHTNWYHFSIKNRKSFKSPIRLNICNLGRKPGLYDQGFRPYVKSKKAEKLRGDDWEQKGDEVELETASMRYEILGSKANNFFRLSFTYDFEFEDDEVFFAYCVPYTYSDLHRDLLKWEGSEYVQKTILGRSLSGLQLPLLHITNHCTQGYSKFPKNNIVITARAHPAESNGSYTLRGFIGWLLGGSREAAELRERCNFFVVPMLNPDGVVMGNSRTSAAGKDLNR
jgi:cytosolic carboxypeptidase protein 2/3